MSRRKAGAIAGGHFAPLKVDEAPLAVPPPHPSLTDVANTQPTPAGVPECREAFPVLRTGGIPIFAQQEQHLTSEHVEANSRSAEALGGPIIRCENRAPLRNSTSYWTTTDKGSTRNAMSSPDGIHHGTSLELSDSIQEEANTVNSRYTRASRTAGQVSTTPLSSLKLSLSSNSHDSLRNFPDEVDALERRSSSSLFVQRLSDARRCDLKVGGGRGGGSSPLTSLPPLSATRATLRVSEEVLAVHADPAGVCCCPLLDPQVLAEEVSGDAVSDATISLSPFLHWKFVPYLPKQRRGVVDRPTIVLDMDETLLHTSVEPMPDADAIVYVPGQVNEKTRKRGVASPSTDTYKLFLRYRPHLQRFLNFCLDHFEVVIFTASKAFYTHAVLRQLEKDISDFTISFAFNGSGHEDESTPAPSPRRVDAKRVITVLHRDHCTPTNVGYTKDLHLLGRNLRRTVLLDNNSLCGVFQPYNMVQVKDFARRRNIGQLPKIQCMRMMQLRQLKEAVPSSCPAVAPEGTVAAHPLSIVECSTSIFDWEDKEDTVLLQLSAADGLLHRLARCSDIPTYLRDTWRFNHERY